MKNPFLFIPEESSSFKIGGWLEKRKCGLGKNSLLYVFDDGTKIGHVRTGSCIYLNKHDYRVIFDKDGISTMCGICGIRFDGIPSEKNIERDATKKEIEELNTLGMKADRIKRTALDGYIGVLLDGNCINHSGPHLHYTIWKTIKSVPACKPCQWCDGVVPNANSYSTSLTSVECGKLNVVDGFRRADGVIYGKPDKKMACPAGGMHNLLVVWYNTKTGILSCQKCLFSKIWNSRK